MSFPVHTAGHLGLVAYRGQDAQTHALTLVATFGKVKPTSTPSQLVINRAIRVPIPSTIETVGGTHKRWRNRTTTPPTSLLTRGEYWSYVWADGPRAQYDTNNYLRREIPHGIVSWPLDITSVIRKGVLDGRRKKEYEIDSAILVMSKSKGILQLFDAHDPSLSFWTTFPNETDAQWRICRDGRVIDVCSLAGRAY